VADFPNRCRFSETSYTQCKSPLLLERTVQSVAILFARSHIQILLRIDKKSD